MKNTLRITLAALSTFSAVPSVCAGSLQIAPVGLELLAPTSAGTLKLENQGTKTLEVQLRVFRWSQVNGQERLEPTTDVVVSPPVVSVAPQSDVTVRVVRLNKQKIVGEEGYRVLVDELPDPATRKNGVLSIVLRQVLPVFFRSQAAGSPDVKWTIEKSGGKTFVSAQNVGQRKLRVSQLKLTDNNGRTAVVSKGLVGYVLGESSMRWRLPPEASSLATDRAITISAQGDVGPINTSANIAQR